jgi:TetR/AcrR family transcriptional repressor of nem operon
MPYMEVTRTQEKILHAAKTLMLSKGYPATTVDEICENAKVSKGSFYHSFSSKEELGLSLLEWYHQGGAEKIFGGSFNDVKDAKQKMFEFLDHVDRSSKELWHNGCLLGNLGMELAETSPKIRIEVSRNFKKLTHRLEEIFEPAAKRKTARGGSSAKELAEQFLVMLEGSIVLARVNQDWSVVKRGFQNFRAHLQSLSR